MKKTLITLACVALAPLAFAGSQPGTQKPGATAGRNTQLTGSNTVGTVTSFEPNDNTITVQSSHFTRPIKYVLSTAPRYVTEDGKAITPRKAIKNGTRVQLDFSNDGTVNQVTVVDPAAF